MALLILLIVLSIALPVGVYVADKYDYDVLAYIFAILSAFAIFGAIFSICMTASTKSDGNYFVDQKAYHDELLRNVESYSDPLVVSKVIEDVNHDNNRIIKHRNNVNSSWIGGYYSKKIAECELTEIPELKVKLTPEHEIQQP